MNADVVSKTVADGTFTKKQQQGVENPNVAPPDELEVRYNGHSEPESTSHDGEAKLESVEDTTSNVNQRRDRDDKSGTSPPTVRTAMMPPMAQRGVSTWPGEAFTTYRKIAKLQHNLFTVQAQLSYERGIFKPKLDRLNESIAQLAQIFEPGANENSPESTSHRGHDAYSQFVTDRQSFETQQQLVRDLEEEFGRLEYSVAKLEPMLLQQVDAHFNGDQPPAYEMSRPSSQGSAQSSPSVQPLAQQYFNKRGEFRLLQDRLEEHLAEDEDEIGQFAIPEIDAKQASTRDPQLINSSRSWQTEYEAIRRELQAAEKELTELWQQCQAAKLDVGSLDTEIERTLVPSGKALQLLHGADGSEFDPPPFLPRGMVERFVDDFRAPPLVEGANHFAKKRPFIEDWVGQIPLGNAGAPGLTNAQDSFPSLDHVVSAPRSDPGGTPVYRAPNDVAPLDGYVMVRPGVQFDPNCEPGHLRRWYRRILRPMRSDEALRPGDQQNPQREPLDEYVMVPNGVRFDTNCEAGLVRRLYRWAMSSWQSSETQRPAVRRGSPDVFHDASSQPQALSSAPPQPP